MKKLFLSLFVLTLIGSGIFVSLTSCAHNSEKKVKMTEKAQKLTDIVAEKDETSSATPGPEDVHNYYMAEQFQDGYGVTWYGELDEASAEEYIGMGYPLIMQTTEPFQLGDFHCFKSTAGPSGPWLPATCGWYF